MKACSRSMLLSRYTANSGLAFVLLQNFIANGSKEKWDFHSTVNFASFNSNWRQAKVAHWPKLARARATTHGQLNSTLPLFHICNYSTISPSVAVMHMLLWGHEEGICYLCRLVCGHSRLQTPLRLSGSWCFCCPAERNLLRNWNAPHSRCYAKHTHTHTWSHIVLGKHKNRNKNLCISVKM